MIICKQCSYQNREGVIYCDNCGMPLKESIQERNYTRKLERGNGVLSAKATWGTARLTAQTEILLHVVDENKSVPLVIDTQSVVGREDRSSENYPDINLMPYGGIEKGVSRRHATIERSEDTLTLMDIGSSNGTFLNGQRLVSHQPRVIRDGDEIRFGKLVTRIYFK